MGGKNARKQRGTNCSNTGELLTQDYKTGGIYGTTKNTHFSKRFGKQQFIGMDEKPQRTVYGSKKRIYAVY